MMPLMDWKLFLEYIKVLIWPTVVLTLGLVFRKQLVGLVRNIDSVETPIGGITFQRQAEAIAEEAAEIEGEIAAEISEPTRRDEPVEAQGDAGGDVQDLIQMKPSRFDRELATLLRMAQSDPTAAVLGAWKELEATLSDVVPLSNIRRTPGAMIRSAEIQGVLPSNLARVANDLRALRNRVVHEGDVLLTSEGATSYVTATQSVIDALSLARTPQAHAIRYEQGVLRAIADLGFLIRQAERDDDWDFVVNFDDRQVGIVVKYRGRGRFEWYELKRIAERFPASVVPGLVVTNVPINDPVVEFNAGSGILPDTAICEVVQWRGGQDDAKIATALQRVVEF